MIVKSVPSPVVAPNDCDVIVIVSPLINPDPALLEICVTVVPPTPTVILAVNCVPTLDVADAETAKVPPAAEPEKELNDVNNSSIPVLISPVVLKLPTVVDTAGVNDPEVTLVTSNVVPPCWK